MALQTAIPAAHSTSSQPTVSRVILDARMVAHSGIGTYIRGLLEGWRETGPEFRPTLLGDPATLRSRLPDFSDYSVIPFSARPYGLWEQWAFPAKQTRGALLHVPHYNVPLRFRGRLVVTIHDLIHLHPQWGAKSPAARFYARWMLRTACRRAVHLFADSLATAADVATQLGVEAEKITVIYGAPAADFLRLNPSPDDVARFRAEWRLPADYLLTVGLYKPHKNIARLLDAFGTLRAGGMRTLSLIVAGTQAKERPALLQGIRARDLSESVRVLDHIPAEQFHLLYRAARALIHPALLEGFGLPVVEAQAVGIPVAASRASALLEVAGDGALFFDPLDVEDMARKIRAVLEDGGLRERLIDAGRRNVRRFSWRESAAKALGIYAKCAYSQ